MWIRNRINISCEFSLLISLPKKKEDRDDEKRWRKINLLRWFKLKKASHYRGHENFTSEWNSSTVISTTNLNWIKNSMGIIIWPYDSIDILLTTTIICTQHNKRGQLSRIINCEYIFKTSGKYFVFLYVYCDDNDDGVKDERKNMTKVEESFIELRENYQQFLNSFN